MQALIGPVLSKRAVTLVRPLIALYLLILQKPLAAITEVLHDLLLEVDTPV